MVNKTLFKTTPAYQRVATPDTVNAAGGLAYKFGDEHALCQYVVTGTFNGTFYATEGEQLEAVKKLVANVNSFLIAKAAVYGHESGKMKDVPAYLLAVLVSRGDNDLVGAIFPRIITNMKMLCNFVQIVRSGATGRRSFGSFTRNLIREWITSRTDEELFKMSIGHANPSFADIIKMVHPRPTTQGQEALFGYLIGRNYNHDNLARLIKDFERFKKDNSGDAPNVPFRALTNCNLTKDHWKKIAAEMPWNTLRMNINTLQRNGVFEDKYLTGVLAGKLSDRNAIKKNNAFPYQLLTTYQNTMDAPREISLALQDAMEIATENVPSLDGKVAVCIGLSGSMGSAITGNRGSVTSKTTCIDVASLMASCFARTNPTCDLVGWASICGRIKLNTRDSVVTNAQKLAQSAHHFGGGTNAELALQLFNNEKSKYDTVIYISDNQSWMGGPGRWGGTGMQEQWNLFKKNNPKAKLVCVDIQPYGDSQVQDSASCLNVGGFSDAVWKVIADFVRNGGTNFVEAVESVEL